MASDLLKLNLGCGAHPKPGYINVDKYGKPDLRHDLEQFPWPWETDSVGEVLFNHVLEHLGETVALYFGILKELYRVCAPGALIHIGAPHPRHDDFITDPTHVRVITPESLTMFSKAKNRRWIEHGFTNSPLGVYLDLDFEVARVRYVLDEPWRTQLHNGQITSAAIREAAKRYNNVIREIRMVVRVVK
ncbi:MAG: class I SAM-dependent methyltransferase [Pirellulales bacterium]